MCIDRGVIEGLILALSECPHDLSDGELETIGDWLSHEVGRVTKALQRVTEEMSLRTSSEQRPN